MDNRDQSIKAQDEQEVVSVPPSPKNKFEGFTINQILAAQDLSLEYTEVKQ